MMPLLFAFYNKTTADFACCAGGPRPWPTKWSLWWGFTLHGPSSGSHVDSLAFLQTVFRTKKLWSDECCWASCGSRRSILSSNDPFFSEPIGDDILGRKIVTDGTDRPLVTECRGQRCVVVSIHVVAKVVSWPTAVNLFSYQLDRYSAMSALFGLQLGYLTLFH